MKFSNPHVLTVPPGVVTTLPVISSPFNRLMGVRLVSTPSAAVFNALFLGVDGLIVPSLDVKSNKRGRSSLRRSSSAEESDSSSLMARRGERPEVGALDGRRAVCLGVIGAGEGSGGMPFDGEVLCLRDGVVWRVACKADEAGSEAESAMVWFELRG